MSQVTYRLGAGTRDRGCVIGVSEHERQNVIVLRHGGDSSVSGHPQKLGGG